MTQTELILATIILVMLVVFAFMFINQQKTIDQLTNKLMAKDYKEYVNLNKPKEQKPPPSRKPMSYYDDPSIELED
jgi:cell division protein FtsL